MDSKCQKSLILTLELNIDVIKTRFLVTGQNKGKIHVNIT